MCEVDQKNMAIFTVLSLLKTELKKKVKKIICEDEVNISILQFFKSKNFNVKVSQRPLYITHGYLL